MVQWLGSHAFTVVARVRFPVREYNFTVLLSLKIVVSVLYILYNIFKVNLHDKNNILYSKVI